MPRTESPILYSFRRCPYAMRARIALKSSGIAVELREVVLREKPDAMLEVSPKGTVPVLVLEDGEVLEESLEVMEWALKIRDPEGLTDFESSKISVAESLILACDGPFKAALDHYKYPDRYENIDRDAEREKGASFIRLLDARLASDAFLMGETFTIADAAILPFVRQFAHVDREWFWSETWPNVIRWLDAFLSSDRFRQIMEKYPQWKSGEAGVRFG
ncbi:MAG: glutathione S-transferase [Pseudomonadota bacterium]